MKCWNGCELNSELSCLNNVDLNFKFISNHRISKCKKQSRPAHWLMFLPFRNVTLVQCLALAQEMI